MAKILVLPSEVVDKAESGNSYAFPADNIIMSDKTTSVEEAINSKTGKTVVEGIDLESHTVGEGAEVYNIYTVPDVTTGGTIMNANIATGDWSHAEGRLTRAFGDCSHAEGSGNRASGNGSHAEGNSNIASGHTSHAEGAQNNSNGVSSHVEGFANTADGNYSHAEGTYTIAGSEAQHVQGKYNIEDSSGQYAHIVGWGTSTSDRANIHTITTTGDGWFAGKVSAGTVETPSEPTEANDLTTKKYVDESGVGKKTDSGGEIFNNATDANVDSHAEGVETTASGAMSHAEGNLTTASGSISHAEGSHTTASGASSHAEGNSSDAIGNYSHAEGRETEASGVASHAEGYQSNASGDYSHAEASGVASGDHSHAEGASFATGSYSHAEGIGNTAYTEAQHVEGKYSEPDSEGLYAHIIGWGASDGDRKNINTIDTNGNGWFAGTVEGANGIKVGPSIITYNEDNQMITFNFE